MRDQLGGLLGDPYAPGYGGSFRQQYSDRNPRPAAWDEDAELAKAKAENDAQTGILGWTTDNLRGLGVPEGTLSNLNSAATFAPFTSDALDIEAAGKDIGKAYDNPTWGNVGGAGLAAAMAAAGLIPGVGEAIGLLGSVGKRAPGIGHKLEPIYDPLPVPPRDFSVDYTKAKFPDGPRADASGRLQETMDGDPIGRGRIVGRRVAGGADEALPPTELDALATATTGRVATPVPPREIGGDAGRLFTDRRSGLPTGIALNNTLPPDKLPKVYRHELGHAVDELAGKVPVEGLDKELRYLYNAGAVPDAAAKRQTLPKHRGYEPEEVPREYMAEAIRMYLTDPNYIKTYAPKTAERIRKFVNNNPRLKDIVQFNSLAAAAGLAASRIDREDPESGLLAPDL